MYANVTNVKVHCLFLHMMIIQALLVYLIIQFHCHGACTCFQDLCHNYWDIVV